jgi:hypothetical protein
MNSAIWIVIGFLLSVFLSEVFLKGTKLQTGLTRVLVVHFLIVGILLIYYLFTVKSLVIALIIFWSGAFLTWFGVRSHMESSILLRMLYLLRRGSISESRLLEDYESHYGEAQRVEELFRGGLLAQSSKGPIVTRKGKFILRIVCFLR